MIGVLDRSALAQLGADVQDCEFVVSFAGRYRRMLAQRVTRIVTYLAAGDADAAMDAVLSLKVSSTTVGAHELAALTQGIERHLRRGDLAAARLGAAGLENAADRARNALGDYVAAYTAR